MTDVHARKRQLESRLSALTARMSEIDDELESHRSKDWEELATEREEDEVLEGMGLSAQSEIRQIRAALQRIEDGSFGICTKCGDEISAARLDVVPFTPFCRDCAAER